METKSEKLKDMLAKQMSDAEVSEVSGGTHVAFEMDESMVKDVVGDTTGLIDHFAEMGMPKEHTKVSTKFVFDDEKGNDATVKFVISGKCPKDKFGKDSIFKKQK